MVKKIGIRRLKFFGHVCRLPSDTPARKALEESLRPAKRPKGRPKTTYISVLLKQLKATGEQSIHSSIKTAQNRELWNRNIRELSD
jgi:hypothetical protein